MARTLSCAQGEMSEMPSLLTGLRQSSVLTIDCARRCPAYGRWSPALLYDSNDAWSETRSPHGRLETFIVILVTIVS